MSSWILAKEFAEHYCSDQNGSTREIKSDILSLLNLESNSISESLKINSISKWKHYLESPPEMLSLPLDRQRKSERKGAGDSVSLIYRGNGLIKLRQFARSHYCSEIQVIMCFVQVWLHKISNQTGSSCLIVCMFAWTQNVSVFRFELFYYYILLSIFDLLSRYSYRHLHGICSCK